MKAEDLEKLVEKAIPKSQGNRRLVRMPRVWTDAIHEISWPLH